MNSAANNQQTSMLRASLLGRCPRCGNGALFSSFLNLKESCSSCALSFKFIDTGDGPAIFAIFLLGFFVLGAALWVEFNLEPAYWVHVVLWGVMTPLLALVILRVLKGLLIFLQYRNKAAEGRLEEDA